MPPERTSVAKEFELLKSAVKTLDSKAELLEEKIATMEKNQEVIGRTLISMNDRIKSGSSGGGGGSSEDYEELKTLVKELQGKVGELRGVIDMINPLELVRKSQVRDIVGELMGKKLKPASEKKQKQ